MSEPAKPDTPADNPFVEMVRNPAARTYLIIGVGGLVVTTAVYLLFQQNTVAAAVVFALGLVGLALRSVVGPPAVVACVCYFAFFPSGLPIDPRPDNPSSGPLTDSTRLFTDLLLTAGATVHLIATYRFHAVTRAGMPFDAPATFVKPGAKPTVRPAVPVREGELLFLVVRVGVVVLGGQLLWAFATRLKVDFRKPLPVRQFDNTLEAAGYPMGAEWLPNSISRFMLAAGVILAAVFALWLVFWYWRLHAMNRDEARAACLDMQWATNRRMYSRPEKWRGRVKQNLVGTRPKKGCGAWFLVVGVPAILVLLALAVLAWIGAFR